MAKYYGRIGYAVCEEDPNRSGVFIDRIVERSYFGDFMKNPMSYWSQGVGINDNLNVSNRISIVADPFAIENFQHIKYAEFMGALWKVTNVEVERPRLLLTIGGVYNGETSDEEDSR